MTRVTKKQLALLRSLDTRRGRDETGLFLAEGLRLCAEMASAGAPAELVLTTEAARAKPEVAAVLARFEAAGTAVVLGEPHDVERVSDTVHSQGIVAAARRRETSPEALSFGARAVVVALDAVADPGNVGTVIRTAAWFGADAVLAGRGGADPLNPKVVRATMGGIFHLPVCRDVDLGAALPALRRAGFRIAAADVDGAPEWRSWAASPRVALLLGGEARGIEPSLLAQADVRIAIPRRGAGESLNVAVTAGILLASAER